MLFDGKKLIAVVGHYGSGKTNIAVNLALALKAEREEVMLIDLDIVNPYFRAADAVSMLQSHGIKAEVTAYANTNLDIPAVTAGVSKAFLPGMTAVFDIGGDDAGAIALGRYAEHFKDDYEMLYVVNAKRLLTETPQEAALLLREIEESSKIKATGIINNTNLSSETTPQMVRDSIEYAKEVSKLTGLPIRLTAALRSVCAELSGIPDLFPIELYTRTYW